METRKLRDALGLWRENNSNPRPRLWFV